MNQRVGFKADTREHRTARDWVLRKEEGLVVAQRPHKLIDQLLGELFRRYDRETRLVLVGDAYMYPGEITDRFGAVDWTERNERPGADYLERVREHFAHCAWLNPMAEESWGAPSIRLIRRIFPMYPLTVQGVEQLARDLARNGGR